MEEIRDRLRIFRKSLELSQKEFGKQIGLGASTYSSYENGQNAIPDIVIKSVCTYYGVSEEWLLTGDGEMRKTDTADEKLAAFIADVFRDDDESTRRRIVLALSQFSEEAWNALGVVCDELARGLNKTDESEKTEKEKEPH